MQITRTVTLSVTNTVVKITQSVAMSGEIAKAGTMFEVSANEARDLIYRGKAVAATEAEVEEATSIRATGTIDAPSGPDPLTWRAAAAWGR